LDTLGVEDGRPPVPLGAHLLLHRVADARRRLDRLDLHPGDLDPPPPGDVVQAALQLLVDELPAGQRRLQVHRPDDVPQGGDRELLDRLDEVGDLVGRVVGVDDPEPEHRVDLHQQVVRRDHRLRREADHLLTHVDLGTDPVDERDDEVQPGLQRGPVLPEPLHHVLARLRHDPDRLAEADHRQQGDRHRDEEHNRFHDASASRYLSVSRLPVCLPGASAALPRRRPHVGGRPPPGEMSPNSSRHTIAVAPRTSTTRIRSPGSITWVASKERALHSSPSTFTSPELAVTCSTTSPAAPSRAPTASDAASGPPSIRRRTRGRSSHTDRALTPANTIACTSIGAPTAAATAAANAPPASMTSTNVAVKTSATTNAMPSRIHNSAATTPRSCHDRATRANRPPAHHPVSPALGGVPHRAVRG